MTEVNKSLIELHIAVFLFGFTAILGEVIDMHPLLITWWRVILASAIFLFIPSIVKHLKVVPKKRIVTFLLIGCLVALHWLTFYAAIKASNASITLICLATATFFTALIEPMVMKQKINIWQVGLGLAIIPGMAMIVHSTSSTYHWGIILGLVSAILAATFGSLNKRYLEEYDPKAVTLLEMLSASLLLTFFLPFLFQSIALSEFWPSPMDWLYLIVLAALCTNVAYLLALRVLRHLSAYTTALTINLEPVYGIILAAVLLGQHNELNLRFYIGSSIILLAIVAYSILQKKKKMA